MKNYFDITKIFVSKLFITEANQTQYSRPEQRSVVKFFMAEKCKPCENLQKYAYVYEKICFSQKKCFQLG